MSSIKLVNSQLAWGSNCLAVGWDETNQEDASQV